MLITRVTGLILRKKKYLSSLEAEADNKDLLEEAELSGVTFTKADHLNELAKRLGFINTSRVKKGDREGAWKDVPPSLSKHAGKR